jgi:hypothetical protein
MLNADCRMLNRSIDPDSAFEIQHSKGLRAGPAGGVEG